MDKRFFLALVLTAVVVIATPILFRTSPAPVQRDTASTTRVDSATQASSAPIVESTVRDTGTAANLTSPVRNDISNQAVVPETTIVSTPVGSYRFSTLGAAPISAEIKAYKALYGSDRNV